MDGVNKSLKLKETLYKKIERSMEMEGSSFSEWARDAFRRKLEGRRQNERFVKN